MKLIEAEDDIEKTGMLKRLVSENGLVEMGCYRVLFGQRIRAGFVGQPVCEVDWCVGQSSVMFAILYSRLQKHLESMPEDRNCFEGVPGTSAVKPCFNDRDFVERVSKLNQ